MADTELKPGDIVELKSGGGTMTIASIDGDKANCEWRQGNQGFKESFSLVALQKYEAPARDPFFTREAPQSRNRY